MNGLLAVVAGRARQRINRLATEENRRTQPAYHDRRTYMGILPTTAFWSALAINTDTPTCVVALSPESLVPSNATWRCPLHTVYDRR